GAGPGRDRVAEHPGGPGHGGEQAHVRLVGAELLQLPLERGDLSVELVDQTQTRLERARPRLGQLEPLERPAAANAEQVTGRAGLAEAEQRLVDAVFERAAVLDQVQPEARPLARA